MNDPKDEMPHDIHDRMYKLLFSFPKILKQLIQGYIDEDWKDKIDYERCERIPTNFIAEDLTKLESDILYKVPLLGESEKEIYLYILIEHQSTIDHSMPFRLLVYIVRVWQELCKNIPQDERKKQTFRLPPVFPIVLYNGDTAWNAAMTLKEIIDENELFGDYLPNLKYYLVDIPRYNFEQLSKLKDTLASVFMLENQALSDANSSKKFISAIQKSLKIWIAANDDDFIIGMVTWLIYKLQDKHPSLQDKVLKELLSQLDKKPAREELFPMIDTNIKHFFHQLEQEGIQTGMQQGIQQGIKKSLLRALTCRFGNLNKDMANRIEMIEDQEALEHLLDKAVTVANLSEFKKYLLAQK